MALDLFSTMSSPASGQIRPMQASKWMHVRMLVDAQEFADLLQDLGPLLFVNISSVGSYEKVVQKADALQEMYAQYVQALQEGKPWQAFAKNLCWALSIHADPFYALELGADKWLVKEHAPAVRMQHFHFHYIHEQSSFILTHHAEKSIPWGIEFAFPQFYQEPHSCKAIEVFKDPLYPGSILFRKIQSWAREATTPVPFIIHERKKVAPFRLGKKCFSWVDQYLQNKGLKVYASRNSHDRQ